MEKVKLTRIAAGKSGTGKNGKTWRKVGIQIESAPNSWINGFANDQTDKWEVGTEVNLELVNDPKWGWQFKIPNATDNLEARVTVLEESVNALLKAVKPDMGNVPTDKREHQPSEPESVPTPNEEDDLPF